MADIFPPSLHTFFVQLFGTVAVLGAKSGIKNQSFESFVRNSTKQEKKTRRKKEKEKNTGNREKASRWNQPNLFAFPSIKHFDFFFPRFLIFFFQILNYPLHKNPQKTKPRFGFSFCILISSIVYSSGFVPEMVAFPCF